jgi:hypothetical protein
MFLEPDFDKIHLKSYNGSTHKNLSLKAAIFVLSKHKGLSSAPSTTKTNKNLKVAIETEL